jgi:hypothetical protein
VSASESGVPVEALSLYRPWGRAARLAYGVGKVLHRSRVTTQVDLAPDVVDVLRQMELPHEALVIIELPRTGRAVVGLVTNGRLTHVCKVGGKGDLGLRVEASMLQSLSRCSPSFAAPTLARSAASGGSWGFAQTALLAVAPFRVADVDSVLDLAIRLAQAGVTHGDMAPWNIVKTAGGLALCDWESGMVSLRPLWDLTHYVIQSGSLLRAWPPRRAASMLMGHKGLAHEYGAVLGLSKSDLVEGLQEYVLHRLLHPGDTDVTYLRRVSHHISDLA